MTIGHLTHNVHRHLCIHQSRQAAVNKLLHKAGFPRPEDTSGCGKQPSSHTHGYSNVYTTQNIQKYSLLQCSLLNRQASNCRFSAETVFSVLASDSKQRTFALRQPASKKVEQTFEVWHKM
jgi:hypothetical protein